MTAGGSGESPPTVRGPTGGRRDASILLATRAVRGFGAGGLSIVLALDLAGAGYPDLVVGALLGLTLGAASAWSLLVPRLERRWGRPRVFALGVATFAVGGLLLWADLANPLAVLAAIGLGGIVAGASDVSPLGALEQAVLADVTPARSRTERYAVYNLVGYVGGALGALAAGPLADVAFAPGFLPAGPHDAPMLLYALLGTGLLPAYAGLSVRAARPDLPSAPRTALPSEVGRRLRELSALFAVDAFGGGLIINSLVAYYLSLTFAPGVASLGAVFFLANLAAAASLLLAVPLAHRFGLIPTMVFTHIPSSALLMLVPVSPTFLVASALWIGRAALSQMDVPTRQSFTQAIVPPEARATAAGLTTAARSGQALGGPVTGAFLAAGGGWLLGPFLLAGGVKIAYDLVLYARFRSVRPSEEGAGR